MVNRSKLLKLRIRNIGCIGDVPIEIALDSIVCLVGKNNAGKSTILRAYELAQGSVKFNVALDRCAWAPETSPSEIELDIHVPEGIANIAEEWKLKENDYLILRNKWIWSPETKFEKVDRITWSPSKNAWSDSEKAGGADNVFKSRLPKPVRIGSLEDAGQTETILLELALDPFIQEIKNEQLDPESALAKSVDTFVGLVQDRSAAHQERFDKIAGDVQKAFTGIFPGLELKLDIAMSSPSIKIAELLQKGSGIKIKEGQIEASLLQQGTGSRRALFWSMLRVHNELKRDKELQDKLDKQKEKAEGKTAKAQKTDTTKSDDDLALPGYLLLIDEPENALHPMAARAAQKHLYALSESSDWQVMLTTHSPYFINPLADHTTIVRLERDRNLETPVSARTYISDKITFSDEEKLQLQALQLMDIGFSEVFFGSYPILVEGDTEHAAFIAAVLEENHALAEQITIVRARGKAIFTALIRMLEHFKINFGIVHDTDWPYNSAGHCGMWTTNSNIYKALDSCRKAGLTVRHRFSVPDFERRLGGDEVKKGKPFEAYQMVRENETLKKQVQELLRELFDAENHGPGVEQQLNDADYLTHVHEALNNWAKTNNKTDDERLKPPAKT